MNNIPKVNTGDICLYTGSAVYKDHELRVEPGNLIVVSSPPYKKRIDLIAETGMDSKGYPQYALLFAEDLEVLGNVDDTAEKCPFRCGDHVVTPAGLKVKFCGCNPTTGKAMLSYRKNNGGRYINDIHWKDLIYAHVPKYKVGDRVIIVDSGAIAVVQHFNGEKYKILYSAEGNLPPLLAGKTWKYEFYEGSLKPAPDLVIGPRPEYNPVEDNMPMPKTCDIDQLPYPYNQKPSVMLKQAYGVPIWLNGRFVKVNVDVEKKAVDIACYACGAVVKSFSLEGV